ncbi:MAG TPA: metallophosphoesterase [Cyclobacteriaceae bacterium]|nr:metallophosphoesterase [Cyclobacteriaceae bacterium]
MNLKIAFFLTYIQNMLQSKVLIAVVVGLLVFFIDIGFLQLVKPFLDKLSSYIKKAALASLWLITVWTLGTLFTYYLADRLNIHAGVNQWVMTILMIIYFTKTVSLIVLLLSDIYMGLRKVIRSARTSRKPESEGKAISRSQFIRKAALAAGGVPLSVSVFGISRGAYDYCVKRRTIYLPNLPKSFDGIRIGHISDIHCNPGYFKVAVQGGVDLLMAEKTDVIFFTGDLVNYRTDEVKEYIGIFDKVRAPLGVYSVTGNHDYGSYISWPSEEAKRKNFRDFLIAHKELGYDLLMNEHRFLEQGGDKIAIIGIENWGKGRFPKFGKLDVAHEGTDEAAVKLLLSHDPSHWDLQVRPDYKDIDVMFAGHTHGFQMGIEVGNIKWSPAQYSYKQWADLYREGNQYLYVNRGYGCIGFLGRIGMPPEITIIELKRDGQ